jgi:PAS domain S-box-containing protein
LTDSNREVRRSGARISDPAPAPGHNDDSRSPAIITGNLAGVVESANEAWTRITGFPLCETLDKPIAHFLDAAGIEIALVDFVGQHFLEGRRCTVEFPFRTFDQREIQVHLEVEPIHGPLGELIEFRAVAHDITKRRKRELARGADREMQTSASPQIVPTQPESRSHVALAKRLRDACKTRRRTTPVRTAFDLDLAPDLPQLEVDATLFDRLVEGLLDLSCRRVEGTWAWVTVLCGTATSDRSHVSQAHPIVARFPEALGGAHLFFEIHDSGPTLEPHSEDTRRFELTSIAEALSATLHFDDTPGCGHQALVLIPVAPSHEA